MFSKALLEATYENGFPPKRTKEHEKAEFHRFKTEHLFKNKAIPRDLYLSRLIQHYVIINSIESQLQNLSDSDKESIGAFFSLSYLNELWRTPYITKDLILLNEVPGEIKGSVIAKTTNQYLQHIKKLEPKFLLSHFLMHTSGFMHGGNIIQKKYINPSNQLTAYQIPTNQYNFSEATSFLQDENPSPLALYKNMMEQVDKIILTEEEQNKVFIESKEIYSTMADLYDDLCEMHCSHPQVKFENNSMLYFIGAIFITALLFEWVKGVYNTISINPYDRLP